MGNTREDAAKSERNPVAHRGGIPSDSDAMQHGSSTTAARAAVSIMDASVDKRRKNNASSAESKKRRKEKAQQASLLAFPFDEFRGTQPAILFEKGNHAKQEEARLWLWKARSKIQSQTGSHRNRNQEMYAERQRGMPPPHVYTHAQFCDKVLLPAECKQIKPLANAEFNVEVKKSHDFCFLADGDTFLSRISDQALSLIKHKPEFQGPAICSSPAASVWHDELERLHASQHLSSKSVTELINSGSISGKRLEDPFKFALRAANLHDQSVTTQEHISAYYKHKDKVGNIVCLYSLKGCSFTFIAMQSKKAKQQRDEEASKFDTNYGSVKAYTKYKSSLPMSEYDQVHRFEMDFMKEATRLKLPRLRVYKLDSSDMLVFTACDYLHGSIIPKQEDGFPRALLVFHQLIPH